MTRFIRTFHSAGFAGIFVFAVLLSPQTVSPAFGQERSATDSDDIVAVVSERIEVAPRVEGKFQQEKYIEVLPQPLRSHGRFAYSDKEGLEWITEAPIASRLVFDDAGIRQDVDGKTLWQIGGEQPVVVTITRVMTSVLALDWDGLRNYFELSGEHDQASWQLKLIPKDDVLLEMISRLSVRGDDQLREMTLHEANGDRTVIHFTMMGD